jgi:hypothetical protein
MSIEHDEQPLDAAGMLHLANRASVDATRRLTPDDRLIYVVWAATWPVAFLAKWLTGGDEPIVRAEIAGAVVYALALLVGVIVTVGHVARRIRGISGRSVRATSRWGVAWVAIFIAYAVMLEGIDRTGAPIDTIAIVATSLTTMLVGVMHITMGALWDDSIRFATGAWLLVVGAVSAFVSVPDNYLVVSIGGGTGFLVAALAATRHSGAGA